ncbi:MAG: acyltransferase family protein [Usitatibacter sp.]
MNSEQGGTYVRGLDSLRFVAALWVVFSHLGAAPLFQSLDKSQVIGFVFNGLWGILFSGPAAVIVFFVISGFCIHYPNIRRVPFEVGPYLVRRYTRIGIPMLAAMYITQIAGIDAFGFFYAILWSLVAELMYYTLYPGIRRLNARFGIKYVIAVSYALSLLVVLTDPSAKGYGVFGWKLNWLLGLPCWLLGVRLAELWSHRRDLEGFAAAPIWKWRAYAWASSALCLTLNFHSPIGYAWTLNIFALVAYGWILREIARANPKKPPWPILEWGGKWSYSLYLSHMYANLFFSKIVAGVELAPLIDWICRVAFVLAASYLFFLVVERPAHLLARQLASRGLRSLGTRP